MRFRRFILSVSPLLRGPNLSFKSIFSNVKLRDLLSKQMSNHKARKKPNQSEMIQKFLQTCGISEQAFGSRCALTWVRCWKVSHYTTTSLCKFEIRRHVAFYCALTNETLPRVSIVHFVAQEKQKKD